MGGTFVPIGGLRNAATIEIEVTIG